MGEREIPPAAPVENGVEVLGPPANGEPAPADGGGDGFMTGWASVRDANIRPYADWRPVTPVPLPVMAVKPAGQQQHGHGGHRHQHHQQQQQQHHQKHRRPQFGGPGGKGPNGDPGGGNGRRRKRRGRNRPDRDRNHRDRGPRIPGVYNPGGDY
jgi:hypothetical protein